MKSGSPVVSVIIIFLNEEQFIRESIESVFAQTYENWELLLVDDGSTDRSTAIAMSYARLFPERVRYLEHKGHRNQGMSATRNLGIRHSKGKYIAFLDADDVWLPLKLEEQVALLDAQPEAAMLYGRTQYWYSWTGDDPGDLQRDHLTKVAAGFKLDQLVQPPKLLVLYLRDGEVYPCMCSILVRREVFEDVGRFEEAFRTTNEDMAFHSKVFVKAPVYVSSKCWDRYRMHPNSCWHVAKKERRHAASFAQLEYRNWLQKYLSEQGIRDTGVWEAFRRTMWHYQYPRAYRLREGFRLFLGQLKHLAGRIGRRIVLVPIRRWHWVQPSNMETRNE